MQLEAVLASRLKPLEERAGERPMSTISGTITVGIVLGTITSGYTFTSPLTVTATGIVQTQTDAVSSTLVRPVLINYGTIDSTGSANTGVIFNVGGTVNNFGPNALISGG